jgi:hypothetical protein
MDLKDHMQSKISQTKEQVLRDSAATRHNRNRVGWFPGTGRRVRWGVV